jgi:folate-dependent phosphoribosylglycinamide formyltransferase PurN
LNAAAPLATVLLTSGGAPGAAVLRRLRASRRVRLAGVVLSTRILSPCYGPLRGAWEMVRRSGLRYALYLACAAAPPLRAGAIPVHRTRDVNDAASAAFLAALSPDLIVSAFFNQHIGEAIARLARCGAVNIHPSPLPAFRGADPVFHARLRGAAHLGVTVHRVAPELDRGNILAQETRPLDPAQSVLRATVSLYARGAELLLGALDAIAAGAPGAPQAGDASYHSWPTPEEVRKAVRRGVRLVL